MVLEILPLPTSGRHYWIFRAAALGTPPGYSQVALKLSVHTHSNLLLDFIRTVYST